MAKTLFVYRTLHVRDSSLTWLSIHKIIYPDRSEQCNRAHREVARLEAEYLQDLSKVPLEKFKEKHGSFKKDINRVCRAAGVQEIWVYPDIDDNM